MITKERESILTSTICLRNIILNGLCIPLELVSKSIEEEENLVTRETILLVIVKVQVKNDEVWLEEVLWVLHLHLLGLFPSFFCLLILI